MSELSGKNLIGNQTVAGGETYRAVDPARGEAIAPDFHAASAEDVDRAFQLAAKASEALRDVEPARLADFLDAIGKAIEDLGDDLLERAHAETALPLPRLTGERGRTVGQLRMFAGVVREGSWVEASIDTAIPDREPLPKPDLRRMLVPLGPVAVFGASNFPLAFSVAGGDTASALAAGCPVVVKAHPAHPGTSELVGLAILEAARQTDMPEGIFSLVHGPSPEVGRAMVEHPAATAVAFTGSLGGGRALFDIAARRPVPIPVYAEMGSVNPVFFLPHALEGDVAKIAEGLAGSVTLGVGQFCTNPGLVAGLAGSGFDALVETLGQAIRKQAPGTLLHDGIRQSYEKGLKSCLSVPGVKEAGRGETEPDTSLTQASPVALVTDGQTFLSNPALSEEVFGPSTLAVRCESREELLELARNLEGHLTATLHGTPAELEEYDDLVGILTTRVGRLLFGGFPTGVEVCASMQHGGPYPASTDSRTTSVGSAAITRFARPVCYQNFPQSALPPELRDENPRGIWRLVDGERTR